jgi:hypothetical protein
LRSSITFIKAVRIDGDVSGMAGLPPRLEGLETGRA